MQKIILINGYRVGRPILPTGLGYVAQAIEDEGFQYDVCDTNLMADDEIVQFVKEKQPQYIGCGTMTYGVEKNYDLLKKIHATYPQSTIILGGPHAIAAKNKIFQECPLIDVVIQGEGEKSIIKLLKGASWKSIPGIITKDSESELNPPELIKIDSVAFPKYHKFDLSKYEDVMNIASSRGCVYNCLFCGAPKFLGRKWRAFKASRMIEEFEYWHKKGYRKFYFSDSLFALSKNRIIEFCNYIINANYKEVSFTADGLRADNLTLEMLQKMKMANFSRLTFGVESVNEKTLEFFRKGQTFKQIDKVISIADKLEFDISIYLIIGAPNETYDDAMNSIMYPMKYKNISNSIISKLVPVMGTSYFEYAIKNKLIPDDSVYYPEMEAYGTNRRRNSHSQVEKIWDDIYPMVEKSTKFLKLRRSISKKANRIGYRKINVKALNRLTIICLNPLIYEFVRYINRALKTLNLADRLNIS